MIFTEGLFSKPKIGKVVAVMPVLEAEDYESVKASAKDLRNLMNKMNGYGDSAIFHDVLKEVKFVFNGITIYLPMVDNW